LCQEHISYKIKGPYNKPVELTPLRISKLRRAGRRAVRGGLSKRPCRLDAHQGRSSLPRYYPSCCI